MENIESFFEGMFADDKDLKKFRTLASMELDELQETCRAKINIVVNELKFFVIKQHNAREEESRMFKKCLSDAKNENDSQSIIRIRQFQKEKKRVWILWHIA